MLHHTSSKTWAALAVAAAATFGASGAAQAKVYSGTWDPNYGGIFGNLGWRGSVEIYAPQACNGLTGTFANGDSPCGGGQLSILSASVQFYDIAFPDTVVQTFNFNPASTSIYGVTLEYVGPQPKDTDLKGLDTGFFAPIKGTTSLDSVNNYYWHLGFTGAKALLVYTDSAAKSPLCAFAGAQPGCGLHDYTNYPTTVTFIPEPQSYALMLAGLGAIGFVARRRRPARQAAASASA